MDLHVPATPFEATNQYVVKERIGGGGMGTVFRAFDVQLKRHVALKILNTLDQDSVERFVREREITADLDHPNFVRILSMGYLSTEQGRRPFYTMPLLRGETLGAMIHRRRRRDEEGEKLREEFTLARLLQLVQQLCLALESAHDRGIIHRDLKPANIILGPYGELYIVDLGLAKYVHEDEAPSPARPGGGKEGPTPPEEDMTGEDVVGTPYFMAPEQILNPACVDARSDIFGLGAILYHVLTGQHPMYRSSKTLRSIPDLPVVTRKPDDSKSSWMFPQWNQESEGATPSSRAEIMFQTLNDVLIPPDELAARQAAAAGPDEGPLPDPVDPALGAICMKALARKPGDRYPGCRAMWQELQHYLEGRFETILQREAKDFTRTMSRNTLPTALRDYEMAEHRLLQRIAQKESVGRLGFEEKLDLFDLLLEKAKVYERRGDSASIIRSVTRAEPIIETALEVLHRQFIQLLIAKGAAQSDRKDHAGAKAILAKAIALSRVHMLDDLMAAAYGGYGAACAGTGDPTDFEEARAALEDSISLADRAGDVPQGIRSRISLARLHLGEGGSPAKAGTHLTAALRKARQDPALLIEVHLGLGVYHLGRKEIPKAVRDAEIAMRHADEMDAQNRVREAHFLLGQACHALNDDARRVEHFRQALKVRGPRRIAMEDEIAAFYAMHRLDPAELGLNVPRETPSRSE